MIHWLRFHTFFINERGIFRFVHNNRKVSDIHLTCILKSILSCLTNIQRHGIVLCLVDGKWKSWGDWEACNGTCGGGIQRRLRECEGPFHGGANCTGPDDDYQECNTHPCPGNQKIRKSKRVKFNQDKNSLFCVNLRLNYQLISKKTPQFTIWSEIQNNELVELHV